MEVIFKTGDVVKLKTDFPYVDRILLSKDFYIIDKVIPDAGVVTLVNETWNKTFPEEAFELCDKKE